MIKYHIPKSLTISSTISQSQVGNFSKPIDIPKSPIKNNNNTVVSVLTYNITDPISKETVENKTINQLESADTKINQAQSPSINKENNNIINISVNTIQNSNAYNINKLIISQPEMPPSSRSPHRINKLFYKKKNPMLHSAEFNMSTLKQQNVIYAFIYILHIHVLTIDCPNKIH